MGAKSKTLNDLLVQAVREAHGSEKAIGKAFPKLAKAASAKDLSAALDAAGQAAEARLERLDAVLDLLDKKPHDEADAGCEGVIASARTLADTLDEGEALDAGLAATARTLTTLVGVRYDIMVGWASGLDLGDVAGKLADSRASLTAEAARWDRPAAAARAAAPFDLKAAALIGLQ